MLASTWGTGEHRARWSALRGRRPSRPRLARDSGLRQKLFCSAPQMIMVSLQRELGLLRQPIMTKSRCRYYYSMLRARARELELEFEWSEKPSS